MRHVSFRGCMLFVLGGEPHFFLKNQGSIYLIYDTKPNNALLQGEAIHLHCLILPKIMQLHDPCLPNISPSGGDVSKSLPENNRRPKCAQWSTGFEDQFLVVHNWTNEVNSRCQFVLIISLIWDQSNLFDVLYGFLNGDVFDDFRYIQSQRKVDHEFSCIQVTLNSDFW